MRIALPDVAVVAVSLLFGCNGPDSSLQRQRVGAPPAVAEPQQHAQQGADAGCRVAQTANAAPKRREFVNGCSEDMARVEDFCIDRYEAHLVVRTASGKYAVHSPYDRPEKTVIYEARSEPNTVPQAYINRTEANDACRAAGKRLCRLVEWYRACSGPTRSAYPYGRRYVRGRCNTGKPHLLSLKFGTDARLWTYEEFNGPALNQEPGFLAKTGQYRGCVGPDGVYDMMGNLHEWVSDIVDRSLPLKIPLTEGVRKKIPGNTGNGIFVGGFFSTSNQLGRGCRYLTPGHGPSYHDYSTGFRCCADARVGTERDQDAGQGIRHLDAGLRHDR